jgi:hypothetical protein
MIFASESGCNFGPKEHGMKIWKHSKIVETMLQLQGIFATMNYNLLRCSENGPDQRPSVLPLIRYNEALSRYNE